MRPFIFAVFALFLFLNTKAQTSDSTTIHLQQYKQWYDDGLINQREYDELKSKALNLNQPVVQEHGKWTNPRSLKRIYTIAFAGGSALEVLGAFSFIDAYKWNAPSAFMVSQYGEDRAKRYSRRQLIGTGSLAFAAGTAYLVVGGVAYHKYKKLEVRVSPTGGALSLNF